MSEYKPCPKCGGDGAQKLSFTWWGGIIGPKILTHVKCPSCGTQFNGKSGKDNTTGIIIYTLAVVVLVGAFLIVALAAIIALVALN